MITSSLKILLWGKEIGRLTWDSRKGNSYFELNPSMQGGKLDPFPLMASTRLPTSYRPIMGDKETKIYHKLPPFIADSLPDAWGNQVFENWCLENKIRRQDITPLDILSFIGSRAMGALEFVPETSGISKTEQLNIGALTGLAQRIFAERENAKILPNESLTMQSLIAVGTSAGGRQPKAIIAIDPKTGEIRSGQITGHEGFEYCILKFGDHERQSAEMEMAYYKMAIAAGIEMMPSRLISVEGQTHFITHRFDRELGRKLHMQTLAALYPDADSYEQLLMVCRKMRLPEASQEEVFRRMVFNILANNTDDHNKNFAFLMDEGGNWRLSPAYDMTYIFNVGGFLPERMHCLFMRGKLQGHTLEDALAVAKEAGIKRPIAIINEVANAIRQFSKFAEEQGIEQRWVGAVETCLAEHLAAWGLAETMRHDVSLEIDGIRYENVRIEQAYKGNFHLMCSVGGKERKFVISKSKEEYVRIVSIGMNNLSEEDLASLVKTFMVR